MYASILNTVHCGCTVSHVSKIILNSNNRYTTHQLIFRKVRPLCGYSNVLFSWKVLFFGTDSFSLKSLEKLTEEQENKRLIKRLEVVTSVKHKANEVQRFAEKNNLIIHNWPPIITSNEFDLGIVVSFGHLIPENIISSFPLGMLNVHASLLPRWRGAAPIVYALMNGDKETGITVMQVKPHKFDVGGILKQGSFPLSPNITFPEVRDALAYLGSEILLESIKEMPYCLYRVQDQPKEGVTCAPRISPTLSFVNWNVMSSIEIYNLWRALDGIYPLTSKWHGKIIKLYHAKLIESDHVRETVDHHLDSVSPGYVFYHRPSKLLRVKCSDNQWISFKNVGIPGRKVMSCVDFYNGYISKQEKNDRYLHSDLVERERRELVE